MLLVPVAVIQINLSPGSLLSIFLSSIALLLAAISAFCNLDIIQLHGNESPEFCSDLSLPVIKAFTPQTLPEPDQLRQYSVDAFMLDKQKGSNTALDELWPIARDMTQYGKIILAGSLTAENVAKAIGAVQPYGVDVASGVEQSPGKKDHQKIKKFINNCKGSKF